VIEFLMRERPQLKLILFGQIASVLEKFLPLENLPKLAVEHPYNHTFITHPEVLAFFKPLHLLRKNPGLQPA
jgi:uracil-DNA glycosylase